MTAVRLTGLPAQAGTFGVASASRPGVVYRVIWGEIGLWCECPGYAFRGDCKHAAKVVTLVTTERDRLEWREQARLAPEEIAELFDA